MMRPRQRTRNRHGLSRHADVAAANSAVANQPRRDESRRVARDREAEALCRHDDRGVDADDVAARVDQRPAGVAGVERGVGLNDVVDQPPGLGAQRPAERADDARGDRMLKTVGVADGDRHLPDPHRRELPSVAQGSGPPSAPMRITARSVSASRPTRSARSERPSGSRAVNRAERATTWLLVRMRPSGVKITPEPPPRSTSIRTTAGPTVSTACVTARE